MSTIEDGEKLGEKLAIANISTSQIRKFLSAVNMINNKIQASNDNFDIKEVSYLRVKLAYQAGRERNFKPFYPELNQEIVKIKTVEDFKEFAQFIEAVVAYHKFYGGKD